jgi:hypothetical protein
MAGGKFGEAEVMLVADFEICFLFFVGLGRQMRKYLCEMWGGVEVE